MICNESAHLSPAELTWLISSTWLNMHLINTGCIQGVIIDIYYVITELESQP